MLPFYIFVLQTLLIFASLLGGTLALLLRRKRALWLKIVLGVISIAGLISALTVYALKILEPKKMLKPLATLNRQMVVSAWICALAVLLLLLLTIVFTRRPKISRRFEEISLIALVTMLAFLCVHLLPQTLLKMNEFVAFNEDTIGTGTLFRVGGYLLGLLTIALYALCIQKLMHRLDAVALRAFGLLWFLLILFDMTLRGVSSAARLQLISRKNPLVFDIMIMEDSSLQYTAPVYLIAVLLMSVYVFVRHLRLKGEFATHAERRKQRWWLRNCRRWAVSALAFMLLICVSVTYIDAYINRPVELAPAEEYQIQNGVIMIPLTQIEDGHLHRFAFDYEGHNIRFIAVRKPGSSAYGVGLDACDICGIAGYFERNNDVICKRCDVVMNKATIGFKGGCNPVPFEYEIKDGVLHVNTEVLIREAYRFPVGE